MKKKSSPANPPQPANTVDLRAAGIAFRKSVPRRSLGEWQPALRTEAPLAVLDRADRGRLRTILPLKHERMAATPFAFFRGAAALMAYDLSLTPHTGIVVQLCGDAHVQNLGAFAGSDGRLTFDINDFDESLRGPFEWDVKRMATSILLAASTADMPPAAGTTAARKFLASYCDQMSTFARLPVLEVARFQVHRLRAAAPLHAVLRKAERATPLHSLERLTEPAARKSTTRRFRNEPPLLWRVKGGERAAVLGSLKAYRRTLLPERQHFLDQFRVIDVAFKVVGTGAVGLRDYCIYLEGNGPSDPLFLQVKQEMRSAWAPFLPAAAAPEKNQGERVAHGQRAMQLQSDPLLGWTSFAGHDYLVRQLNDHKAALDITTLDAAGLQQYAQVCGELLARGHARSGDARVLAGYLGSGKPFAEGVLQFAETYATQTVADWKSLQAQRLAGGDGAAQKRHRRDS